MPPRKTRAAKKADKADAQEAAAAKPPSPPPVVDAKGKGKEQQQDDEAGGDAEVEPAAEQVEDAVEQSGEDNEDNGAVACSSSPSSSRTTMEERRARLAHLKSRLSASSSANRKDLHLDKAPLRSSTSSSSSSSTPRRNIGKEHKLRKAEATLDKRDADEAGRDYERVRNWGYTMEDQERWEEKLAEKEESRDKGLIDANGLAARSYQRGVGNFKPDLKGYRQLASSSGGGGSSSAAGSSSALVKHDATTGSALIPATSSSTLSYGTHRPSGEAVDRVITHLNMEADARNKRSRKRPAAGQEDEEVTYINEKNAHFNRKINRFFDEHTSEIRENFERGTAL